MFERFENMSPTIGRRVFVASTAVVIGEVAVGDDVSIWHHAVVRGDINWIRIGSRSNLQDGVIVHVESGSCPTLIEEDVSVGHGAILHGCTIGSGVLVGLGAKILNNAVIGNASLVAAGAVVREGFESPPQSLIAGVPAVVKRPLTEDEAARVGRTAQNYVTYKNRYLAAVGGPVNTDGGTK